MMDNENMIVGENMIMKLDFFLKICLKNLFVNNVK